LVVLYIMSLNVFCNCCMQKEYVLLPKRIFPVIYYSWHFHSFVPFAVTSRSLILNSYCLIVSTQLRNQNGIILKSEFRGARHGKIMPNPNRGKSKHRIRSGDELSILNGTLPSENNFFLENQKKNFRDRNCEGLPQYIYIF
jgi:hypothetical protein